jgi:hypothetical protein
MIVGTTKELFGPDLRPYVVGPLPLTPVDVNCGDRMVFELGSQGPAKLETRDDGQTWCTISPEVLEEDFSKTFSLPLQSREINRCIYCMSDDSNLTKEHVVPYALNGNLTLTKASCINCNKFTSEIEDDILWNLFGPARCVLRLQTRHPERRPSRLPINLYRGGQKQTIQVPIERYPTIIAMPVFLPPAYLSGESYTSGIRLLTKPVIHYVSGPSFEDLAKEYKCDGVTVVLNYSAVKFARWIAKIGYGYAVLKLGLGRIKSNFVLPALLGNTQDIGKWVGCPSDHVVSPSKDGHFVKMEVTKDLEVHVFVRLFTMFDTPEYIVVVGSLK